MHTNTVGEINRLTTWEELNGSKELQPDVNTCLILQLSEFSYRNNPDTLISEQIKELVERLKTFLLPILFLTSAPANCVSMLIFFKQGFSDRINVCLFSLSLIDLTYLLFLITLYAENIYLQFTTMLPERYGPIYRYMVNNNVIGLYGLSYASMFLSMTISADRCLCVMMPLRSRQLLTAKTTTAIVGPCLVVITSLRFVVTLKYKMFCMLDTARNVTFFEIFVNDFYVRHKNFVDALDGTFYGLVITIGTPAVVLVTSSITANQLRRSAAWRNVSSSYDSNRDVGLIKMLLLLSVEFMIFSVPNVCVRVLPLVVSELKLGGRNLNIFVAMVGIAEICSFAASSVNFLVYYTRGSKYRATFHNLCSVKKAHLK